MSTEKDKSSSSSSSTCRRACVVRKERETLPYHMICTMLRRGRIVYAGRHICYVSILHGCCSERAVKPSSDGCVLEHVKKSYA